MLSPKLHDWLEKGESFSLKSEDKEKYIDSIIRALQSRKKDSTALYYYSKASIAYFNNQNFGKSLNISRVAQQYSEEAADTSKLAKAYQVQGMVYYQNGVKDTALRYYQRAEKLYERVDDPDLGIVLLLKAYILHDVGEFVLCESEASIAIKLLREYNKHYEIYQCLVVIASALNEQDNAQESVHYYKEAISQIDLFDKERVSDDEKEMLKAICQYNLGAVYEKSGNYNMAMSFYKKALSSSAAKPGTILYSRVIGSLANVESLKGETKGVKSMLETALKISGSLSDDEGVIAANISLAHFYVTQRDSAKAVGYYKKAYNGAKKLSSNSDRLKSLKELSVLDHENSAKYSTEYFQLNDSLQKVALQNRNKYARIEYETDQLKDANNALLRKNSFIIGVSVLVLLFVAAVFIIYYLNSRNKQLLHVQEQQKANEEIYQLMFEQQDRVENARSEEKNRIAMELHDGILNNIYAVRLNLEFSNRKNDAETIEKRRDFIKELQGVESEIRAVSHDLSRSAQFIQGKDFAAMLEFMVTTQKNNFETEFDIAIDKDIDWDNVPNTYKVNIYRIIQEALQNVNKYSKATHAHVEVKTEGRQLVVTVQDNGVGFDTKKAATGIGIKNLKKRSEALNGLLEIDSEKGKGASVKVQFALR